MRLAYSRNVRGPALKGRVLRPGGAPPMLTPYCGICDQPAERFQLEVPTDHYRFAVHAECCGKQQSRRITTEEFFRLRSTNEKLYVVTGKGRAQTIKAQAKR